MNPQDMLHLDETRSIVAAVRQIREDSSVLAVAKADVARALDHLGLNGNSRTIVAPLLSAALAVAVTAEPFRPLGFWS